MEEDKGLSVVGCQGGVCDSKLRCYRYVISMCPLKIRGISHNICNSFMSISTGEDLDKKITEEDRLFREIIESYSSPIKEVLK